MPKCHMTQWFVVVVADALCLNRSGGDAFGETNGTVCRQYIGITLSFVISLSRLNFNFILFNRLC